VVTDGDSDDCNGERMDSVEWVYLQIVRRGDHWGLHHSSDGKKWRMARFFCLALSPTVKVGLEAQSPLGKGTMARFSHLFLGDKEIQRLRQGI
jgi:regulation of enolase protein 1 (concanavalin A-like superfamily)